MGAAGPLACRGRARRPAALLFAFDGLPPDTKPDGAMLKLTAVSGEQAVEVPYRLD